MSRYADRLTASFYSNETDLITGVQWILAIPHSQAVSGDDYDFVKWQIVASAEDKGSIDNDKARLVTYDGTTRVIGA